MREVYVSVDVEADGPIPGPFSLLSLGAAAFLPGNPAPVSTFKENLEDLPGACQDPKTMKWWEGQQEAWEASRSDLQDPSKVMHRFAHWLGNLEGRPVFVGYPAGYDFTFVHWYLVNFTGSDPFGFSALDIKTMAYTMLGLPFRQTAKRRMPERWFEGGPAHTHDALQDAIGQGVLFINMLKELRG